MIGATESLARFAFSADVGSGSPELRRYARRSIADTVAVAIAGAGEDAVRIVTDTMVSGGTGEQSALWTEVRSVPVDQAALVNGTAAHALDFDDVAEAIHTHPGAVMTPALLAVAEAIGASGRDVLDAFVIGYEVQIAICEGLGLHDHIARGWHGTSSIAGLGGAAAVARLMGLDIDRIRAAMAIAASMAGGSRQNFGTMTKPLHAGMTARDSVLAARLSANGLTASLEQLEGAMGYLTNFGDGASGGSNVVEAIGQPWWLERTPLNLKPYPCCYRAARTAHAAVMLHNQGLDARKIESIVLTIEPAGTAPLIYDEPRTGLQGKFSGQYVLATGLLDGSIPLRAFTDEAVNRVEAQNLLGKVRLGEAERPPFGPPEWEGGFATVEVTLIDGSTDRLRVDVPHGHDLDPLTDQELDEKIVECVRFSKRTIDAEALVEQLRALDSDEPFRGLDGMPVSAERLFEGQPA